MNYLKSYDNEAAYLADATKARIKAKKFLLPNVSLVKDTKVIHFNKYVDITPNLGDLYIYDGTDKYFIDADTYIDNSYSANPDINIIGVVVVPVYVTQDNTVRVMAFTNTDGNFYWGSTTTVSVPQTLNKYVNIEGTGYTRANDPDLGTEAPLPLIRSNNYIKNDIFFYNTTINGFDFSRNALSDINGKENTDSIIAKVTVENWQTITTLPNSKSDGNYPAACAARRYSTRGTNKGDWYLPALGELLHYLTIPNMDKIRSVGFNILTGKIWSSTEYSNKAHFFNADNICPYLDTKGVINKIRPFLKVEI